MTIVKIEYMVNDAYVEQNIKAEMQDPSLSPERTTGLPLDIVRAGPFHF